MVQGFEAGLGLGSHERIPDGVRIPVRWSLSEAGSGRVVARGDDETFGTSSWSSDEIDRNVNHLSAAPGSYRLQARMVSTDGVAMGPVSARADLLLTAPQLLSGRLGEGRADLVWELGGPFAADSFVVTATPTSGSAASRPSLRATSGPTARIAAWRRARSSSADAPFSAEKRTP